MSIKIVVVTEQTIECEIFLRVTYASTSYDEYSSADGRQLFQAMMLSCQSSDESTECQETIRKFQKLSAGAISQRAQYREIVKVVWRYVQKLSVADQQRRLFLMCMAVSTVTVESRRTAGRPVCVDKWRDEVAKWLGEQLTCGGKGVVDVGEGCARERLERFFSTPYLHDFD